MKNAGRFNIAQPSTSRNGQGRPTGSVAFNTPTGEGVGVYGVVLASDPTLTQADF